MVHTSINELQSVYRVVCHTFFIFFFFSSSFPTFMCLMRCLHLARSCGSSFDNSLSDKSFLMLSSHLRFGLPLLLFRHHSLAYLFVFSSQYMPIPLQPTFLHVKMRKSPSAFCARDVNLGTKPRFVSMRNSIEDY